MNIADIEEGRRKQKRTVAELCRTAGIAYSTYWFATKHRFPTRDTTFRKLARALATPPTRPRIAPHIDLIRTTYRGFVAALCAELGVAPAAVLALSPQARANANAAWAAAARIRAMAVYCTVVELDLRGKRVGEAIGVTRQAVSEMLKRVEDMREDARLDAVIERVGGLIAGREAERPVATRPEVSA